MQKKTVFQVYRERIYLKDATSRMEAFERVDSFDASNESEVE